jgi:hypothetical protein
VVGDAVDSVRIARQQGEVGDVALADLDVGLHTRPCAARY